MVSHAPASLSKQAWPRGQVFCVPAQVPLVQTSPVVQARPSLQLVPVGKLETAQVPFGSWQVFCVQELPVAVQVTAVPPQTPAAHLSPVVQAWLSLQVVPSLEFCRWQRPSVVWPQTLSMQAVVLAGQVTDV